MDYATDDAITKFRTMEHLWLRIEVAEFALEQALAGNVNMNEYFMATERIRNEYEMKRKRLEESRKLRK
jgi:hypothetical protein